MCTQGGSRPTRGVGNCSGTAATLGQSRWQREGTEGTELGGPTASGSPGQSHTLQGWHSTNTAPLLPQGCRQHLRSGGNHQSSRKSKPPCPHATCLTPEPGSLGLQSPGILWAQSPWDQPRSCLLCQHGHPSANLPKPTSTGAVPALGQGPKHRHRCRHTPRGWDCAGHPVGAVTSQPRSCTETRHNQHPWPEISEKAPQLMIMAEPFQGVEINSTLHRSCAGRGGEHRASSSRVT